jgi:mRNA interferase MazF
LTTSTAAERSSPERGDIVWVDLDPVRGSEQAGVRPALVVSATPYNAASHHAIVCPITSNANPWPTKLDLPPGLPIRGAVLLDQVRSVDRRQRGFRHICKAPPELVLDVTMRIAVLLGVTLDPLAEPLTP